MQKKLFTVRLATRFRILMERASKRDSLLRDERGAEFIEKLLLIALFVFAVAFGVRAVADQVLGKLNEEAKQIKNVNVLAPQADHSAGQQSQ